MALPNPRAVTTGLAGDRSSTAAQLRTAVMRDSEAPVLPCELSAIRASSRGSILSPRRPCVDRSSQGHPRQTAREGRQVAPGGR